MRKPLTTHELPHPKALYKLLEFGLCYSHAHTCMNYFTHSWGIKQNPQLAHWLGGRIHLFKSPRKQFPADAVLLGWGNKPNTQISQTLANQQKLPYWALEDGFIAYAGHPTFDQQRLSLVRDEIGIYYDSRHASGLDYWLTNLDAWFDADLAQRIERLRQQLVKLEISKYNQTRACFPSWLQQLVSEHIPLTLVVDQTFGDCSIEGAQADANDFQRMLSWAVKQAEGEQGVVILKVHPDVVLGDKKGYFDLSALPACVKVLQDDVSPAALIRCCARIATVSSQLGFEALWQAKPVHCFGIPFYAQRGVTHDHARAEVKRDSVSVVQLMAAALIKYVDYWHPERQQVCDAEDVLDWLQAQLQSRTPFVEQLDVVGVSIWKRSFIPEFVGASAAHLGFIGQSKATNTELHWGMKTQADKPVWRMEDGFIRSAGLGADLRRPSSLVLDDEGIYYNGLAPSRLETLLNTLQLNDYERLRAEQLRSELIRLNVTKYNVETADSTQLNALKQQAGSRQIVLVTGQFQDDLSIAFGTRDIKTNMALIEAARQCFADAFIIYKEHPDVYSGVRPGKLDEQQVRSVADAYVTQLPLPQLFEITDRLCTMCSLSGFEALLRGIAVSTFGLPFYAGWGLTDDRYSFERRKKTLDITELLYGTLVLYPRYVNWYKRTITTPETVIEQICHQRHNAGPLRSSWIHRQVRKLSYLSQALFHSRS